MPGTSSSIKSSVAGCVARVGVGWRERNRASTSVRRFTVLLRASPYKKCVGKKNPAQREKNPLRVYSTTTYVTSPNVRGKLFASVIIHILSQVCSQALVLVHVLRLSPGIKNGSHAGCRRVGGGIQSRGRVANGVNVVHCRSDAADAAVRCKCPGGSNTVADATGVAAARCKCPGGSSAASLCPTALFIATT